MSNGGELSWGQHIYSTWLKCEFHLEEVCQSTFLQEGFANIKSEYGDSQQSLEAELTL